MIKTISSLLDVGLLAFFGYVFFYAKKYDAMNSEMISSLFWKIAIAVIIYLIGRIVLRSFENDKH